MYRVVIVEDEAMAADFLKQRVEALGYTVTAMFEQYSELLVAAQDNNLNCDVLLLDIHVGDGNSFAIFQTNIDWPPVIFTTANADYAVKGFEVACCDYLLKPFSDERLASALEKAVARKSDKTTNYATTQVQQYSRVLARRGKVSFVVDVKDIAYFYKQAVLHLVTFDGQTYVHDMPLDELTSRLNPNHFFRLNRQWIVNIQAVSQFQPLEGKRLEVGVVPPQKKSPIVSQDKVKAFKHWLQFDG